MKIHFFSLLLVATVALANSVPNADGSQRRTLIGNEFTYQIQGDSSHGNTHTTSTTTITRIHKEPSPETEQWIWESELFDRHVTGSPTTTVVSDIKDTTETRQLLDRRGLLWGGRSTSISNVNDNSQSSKAYNTRGNQSMTMTKVVSTTKDSTGSNRRHGGEGSWPDVGAEEDKNERVLDHGQNQSRRFLYKFHPNHKLQPQPQHQGYDIGVDSIDKRGMTTLTTTTTAIVDVDDYESKKKVDGIARRNLVTIQIITQNTNTNTNGHSIDTGSHNNNVFPVKVIQRNNKNNNDKEKKKSGSSSPKPRSASKENKKAIAKSNQHRSRNKKADQYKKSAHATNLSRNKRQSRNRKTSSNKPRPSTKHAH